jgi:hypothetical protein
MIGTTAIREKREIQWDRGKIRVSKKGQVQKKNCVKNNMYHSNRGEERNLVGYVPNTCVDMTTIIFFFYFYS